MSMWLQPSPWPGTTKQCSGEGQDILVDGGALGEVCSKSGKWGLFHQHYGGFVFVGSYGRRQGKRFGLPGPSLAPLSSRRPQNGKTAA